MNIDVIFACLLQIICLQLRCEDCKERGKPTCAPQWGKKRIATMCVECVKRRKGCITTQAWKEKMRELFPLIGYTGMYICNT